ncbi:unnamed protein product [Rotaria sp. Silwood2]|nr:unnamed protein product [Rotaria sp. Silwood2]CAF3034074.1 unnamed protein product [Rotaria sp. Silwood2]CAF3233904.1 unnamed protein product [Rotaria sp. Silwood2]CAF3378258.1 unnamed protein product [Rotaria sp. Silwood2]CAF4101208.1 unnamed protein product [Rotaria sp. Silwood2]
MIKLTILVTFICLGLVSARSFGGHGGSGGDNHHERPGGNNHHGGSNGGNNKTIASTLCANTTLAALYVTQIQAIITQLINNGSFTDWLQQHAQEVAYFQNADNTALLSSNCTGYFSGLDAARALDMTAQNQREQYTKIGNGLFRDILHNLVGNVKDDSDEK